MLLNHDVLKSMLVNFHDPLAMVLHGFVTLPFWFTVLGVFFAWFNTLRCPKFPEWLGCRFKIFNTILVKQYGFDAFNDWIFVRGVRRLSQFLFHVTDLKFIDGKMVDGSGKVVLRFSQWIRQFQSGYLYHYVSLMVIGLIVFLVWTIL